MRFKIVSLGCPKNLVESEYITASLEKRGDILSDQCDTVIINTCAFITDAAKESIETILEETINREGKKKRLVVTGCLVERYGEKLRELLPEVDLFVGRNFYDEIGTLIDKKGFFQRQGNFSESFPRKVLTAKPTAYLKIQEGCDNRCSYCTVPNIRGGLRSRSMGSIREELEWLLAEGFKEINIIGQDITSYGKYDGLNLRRLLSYLLKIKGDYFLRLLYMHPKGINKDLIDLIGNEDRIIKYMDIPIQHSEDNILNLMGRGYDKRYLARLFGNIREDIPDALLRTTVIVGFPGETQDEFSNLCDFIKTWEFDMLGAFMYSKEEGTVASKLKGHIKKGVKQERHNTIIALQKDISKERLRSLIGKNMKVIVEGKEGGYMAGRLLTQAPDIDGMVFIKGTCNIGEIREGKIVKTLDYDVIVEV
ncbi:MAG: 30S ribosomal protein S12 methylthiotransferase RimO [Proteobacteria bacterium]|nr:30S ribosomal protein S12 methylthiotransferase RimO [Pseudomonadota bacterium]